MTTIWKRAAVQAWLQLEWIERFKKWADNDFQSADEAKAFWVHWSLQGAPETYRTGDFCSACRETKRRLDQEDPREASRIGCLVDKIAPAFQWDKTLKNGKRIPNSPVSALSKLALCLRPSIAVINDSLVRKALEPRGSSCKAVAEAFEKRWQNDSTMATRAACEILGLLGDHGFAWVDETVVARRILDISLKEAGNQPLP